MIETFNLTITEAKGSLQVNFVYLNYASNVDTRKFLPNFVFTLFGTTTIERKVNNHWLCYLPIKRNIFPFLEGVEEDIWLIGMIRELGITQEYVKKNCNSQSIIHLINYHVYHERTKHIDFV